MKGKDAAPFGGLRGKEGKIRTSLLREGEGKEKEKVAMREGKGRNGGQFQNDIFASHGAERGQESRSICGREISQRVKKKKEAH